MTDGNTIVFKGNYSVPDPGDPSATVNKTGVYYRTLTNNPIGDAHLTPAGGDANIILIANSSTLIPGTKIPFGSTAPPSAAGNWAVFAGFDNEDAPTSGGIYLARLNGARQSPALIPLVKIGSAVPGERRGLVFNKLGEGVSFDGRFVGFWGAWGSETKELILQCPSDGNKSRVAFCRSLYGDGVNPGTEGNGFHTQVPVHQGIFVYDILTGLTWAVAKSPTNFADFIYWNFSGQVPPPQGGSGGDGGTGEDSGTAVIADAAEGEGTGGGMDGGEADGEPARWRSASFVAVSGLVTGRLTLLSVHAAFKARTGEAVNGTYVSPKDGIYLRKVPELQVNFTKLVETGMDGTKFDPAATYIPVDENGNPIGSETSLPVTSMGIEREGFRGNAVAVNIGMGNEEAGWAGIYLTEVPR